MLLCESSQQMERGKIAWNHWAFYENGIYEKYFSSDVFELHICKSIPFNL